MADGRAIDPAVLHPGLPLDARFSIVAVPNLAVVTSGAHVTYKVLYNGGVDYPQMLSPEGPWVHAFTWYKFADKAVAKNGDGVYLERGPLGAREWQCKWGQVPGRYIIGCLIWDRIAKRKNWCFLEQRVVDVDTELWPLLGQSRRYGAANPDEAIGRIQKLIATEKLAFAFAPGSTPEEFQKQIERYEEYMNKLAARLAPTKDKVRIPIYAVHLATASQERVLLTVFIAKLQTIPKHTVSRRDAELEVAQQEEWALVDYTDMNRPDVHQSFTAMGATDEGAIRHLLSAWNMVRNRYPEGRLAYEVRVGELLIRDSFDTNGRTALDFTSHLLGCVATGALVVVGVAALFAPVPGSQVVSYAIWAMLFSSTAASAINIASRRQDGIVSWRDDALDGLTIVGNLLAGAGQGAGWVRGATTVAEARPGAPAARWIFIGEVTSNVAQGVLVAEGEIEEYDRIMADRSISPSVRVDRLLAWVQRVSATGFMTWLSVRSSKSDRATIENKNKYLLGKTDADRIGSTHTQIKPPKEKIDALKDKKAEIDTTKPHVNEGTTRPKGADPDKTVTHESKLETGRQGDEITQPGMRKVRMEDLYPPNPTIWREPPLFTDNHIKLVRKLPGHESNPNLNLVFEAQVSKHGVLTVTIETRVVIDGKEIRCPELWAKDLYPQMFHYFEDVARRPGGKPIKRIEGLFAADNARGVAELVEKDPKRFVENTLGSGQQELRPEALKGSKSWKYWEDYAEKYRYDLEQNQTLIESDGSRVRWSFTLKPRS